MSETSPTDQVDSGAGSANADLPASDQQPSADGQQTDSVSSDSQDSDQSNGQPGNQTTDDSSSSDDDGLNNFAKAQGFDPDNLTDGERKALKLAHDNQKAFRADRQAESDKLRETVQDAHKVDEQELDNLDLDPADAVRDSEIAQLKAAQRVSDFYIRNPEAREYDKEMTEIVVQEAQVNGKDAARYLAADLGRLLVLAKAARGLTPDDVKAAGAREERERLRKRQEGSGESGQASQTNSPSKKISRSDIATMDDAEYAKLRDSGELDKILARGDLY